MVTSHNGEAGQVLEQALLTTARPAGENLLAALKSALLSKKRSDDASGRQALSPNPEGFTAILLLETVSEFGRFESGRVRTLGLPAYSVPAVIVDEGFGLSFMK